MASTQKPPFSGQADEGLKLPAMSAVSPLVDQDAPGNADAYRSSAADVLRILKVDAQCGLTAAEAQARLQTYGRNELPSEVPVSAWRKFAEQFTGILVILLIIAASISAALWFFERGSALPYEALAILAIVLLNATLGYVQQARAERALTALRQLSAAQANVVRNGERQSIAAAELVPGDIMLIEEGDTIPADGRLVQTTALQTAEAGLTGESLPVAKDTAPIAHEASVGDQLNMIFGGTAVTYGRGRAVVTVTGARTQMGHIAGLLAQAVDEETPLQVELDRVGRVLALIVTVIAIIMIATLLFVEEVSDPSGLFDVLLLGVALAVAAVPEGLPAIVTAVLSLGVQRMAKRNAIVRHLAAIETLGSTDIIASDKTGTLTRNEMTVRQVMTASGRTSLGGTGYAPEGDVQHDDDGAQAEATRSELRCALTAADRASNAVLQQRGGHWTILGDPTEGALIVAARKTGLSEEALEARFSRVAEVPFSSERKRMSTIHRDQEQQGGLVVFTKGAPDVLIEHCSHELVGSDPRLLNSERRDDIRSCNETMAGNALRTLAVAYRPLPDGSPSTVTLSEDVEHDLVFLGLIGMIDPPRAEAKDAVARARQAGIRPMMITGDHPRTAAVIAGELGIASDGRVITGAELAQMNEQALDRAVQEVSVYARVNPEHKLRIVEAFQRQGATIAMTGDGVNDAPALKAADIGIAMGLTGTDVSKQAADMVLADDNFATIVAAVEEGRGIFANIRKFLRYLLSSNIGEVLTMFLGVLLADAMDLTAAGGGTVVLPLLATQILWINLVTDGGPALALGIDPNDARAMEQPPRPRGEGVITGRMWGGILLVGVIMAAGTLFVLDSCLEGGLIEGSGTMIHAQTMAFITLTLFQLFNVFNARSDEQSAFTGLFSNLWLWAAVGFALLLQMAVVYIPALQAAFSTTELTAGDWLWCAAVASSVLWLRELSKLVVRMLDRRHSEPAAA